MTLIVTVNGLDGSGKTIFAQRLGDGIEGRVGVLHVDDVRLPVDWIQPGRSEEAIYYESYFALDELERRVRAALDERPDVLLVEGHFVLRVPLLTPAFAIYIDVEPGVARARVFERDTGRGRTPEDVRHRMEARYFPAQERYVAEYDPRGKADVVIDNGDLARPRLVKGDPARWPAPIAAPLARLVTP